MNTTKLKHIIFVDRTGSFTSAAQELNVSQSTITKSVAEFEERMKIRLFERHARRVSTTAEGREFIDRANRIINDLDRLVAETLENGNEAAQLVRVSICPPSIEVLVNRAIAHFVKHNPSARIHLVPTHIERGIRLLRRGDIDVLIGDQEKLSFEKSFKVLPLGALKTKLFTRKEHPLVGKKRVTDAELRGYPIIMTDTYASSSNALMNRFLGKDGLGIHEMHVLENFGIVTSVISSTDCIGFVNKHYSESKQFQNSFSIIDPKFEAPIDISYAVTSQEGLSPIIRKFITALKSHPPL